jgi:hypothetical protein
MKNFQFNYYGWVPHYNDFDDEQIFISATTKEEAIKIFNSKKRFIKYGPEIIELDTLNK